jgi:hypothetical protein
MRRARAVLKDREVGLFTWWESLDSLMDQIWKKWHDANE